MRFEYELSYEHFKDAQRVYSKHRMITTLIYYVWVWLAPIAGLLFCLPMIANILFGFDSQLVAASRNLLPLAFFLIVFRLLRISSFRTYWKKLVPESIPKRSIKTVIPVAIELTEEQLISTLPGQSEGRYFWSALPDFAEDEKIALIFVKRKQFIFVPKDAMPDYAWEFLKAHLLPARSAPHAD